MVDLTASLGREVATPQQVLEVIRPELRIMRAFYRGVIAAMRAGWLASTPDLELADGGDDNAETVVFQALHESAQESVKQWAHDMGLVYDKVKVGEFVRQGLMDAMYGDDHDLIDDPLPEGALDY
jgi:predicted DNA-binding protein (UPF0278 family)